MSPAIEDGYILGKSCGASAWQPSHLPFAAEQDLRKLNIGMPRVFRCDSRGKSPGNNRVNAGKVVRGFTPCATAQCIVNRRKVAAE